MKTSNAMARKLGNNKGFTLIEMAIVLVIIGIIIGAVVKGQDLVDNAKSKQFASKLQAWQIALNTYYDRKGRFPGDDGKDGIIAGTAVAGGTADVLSPLDDINSAKFDTPPERSFVIGGATFNVSIGNDGGTPKKNFLVVTKSDSSLFSPDDANDKSALKYFEAFDTSIDGTANTQNGTVRGYTTVTVDTATAKLTALSGAPTNSDWLSGTTGDIKALGLQLK